MPATARARPSAPAAPDFFHLPPPDPPRSLRVIHPPRCSAPDVRRARRGPLDCRRRSRTVNFSAACFTVAHRRSMFRGLPLRPDWGPSMDVKCEKCQARYRIDDARVGPAGLTMRCGKCRNTFKVTKGGATQPVAATPAAPPPAAKPPPEAPPGGPPPEGATMMFAAPVIPPKP